MTHLSEKELSPKHTEAKALNEFSVSSLEWLKTKVAESYIFDNRDAIMKEHWLLIIEIALKDARERESQLPDQQN